MAKTKIVRKKANMRYSEGKGQNATLQKIQ